MFHTKVVEKIKNTYSMFNNIFRKNVYNFGTESTAPCNTARCFIKQKLSYGIESSASFNTKPISQNIMSHEPNPIIIRQNPLSRETCDTCKLRIFLHLCRKLKALNWTRFELNDITEANEFVWNRKLHVWCGRRSYSRVSLHADTTEPADSEHSFVQKLTAFKRNRPECLNLCMTNPAYLAPDRPATHDKHSPTFVYFSAHRKLSPAGTDYPLKDWD
jgi:hypothetical protein